VARETPSSLASAGSEGSLDPAGEGGNVGQQLEEAVGPDRLRLSLQRERLDRLRSYALTHKYLRSFAEQDLARFRCLLQAGGDVDGVAGDERLAVARNDLARVDAGAGLEPEPHDRFANLGGRPYRPQRVVLVRPGNPEHGHGGIAHELLDRAAVQLEDRAQLRVVAAHHLAQHFGIGALAERGRADEVAEEDGYGLADTGRRLSGQRGGAGVTEARACRVLPAALRTDTHA